MDANYYNLAKNHSYTPPKKTRKLSDYDHFIAHCITSYNTRTQRLRANKAVLTLRERMHLSRFKDFCIEHGCDSYDEVQQAFDKSLDAILKEGWVAKLNTALTLGHLLANDKLIGRFNLEWFETILDGSGELIRETNNVDVLYKGTYLGQVLNQSVPKLVRLVGGAEVYAYPSELAHDFPEQLYEQANGDAGFRKTKAYLKFLSK